MKSASVLKELKELRESWHKQNFRFDADQRKRYNELLGMRRERVQQLYKEGRVYSGPSGIS